MGETKFMNTYTKTRLPGLMFEYNASTSKVERQMPMNWSGVILSQIALPWSGLNLNRDQLRVF